jgi:hypothetical protein
MAARHCLAAILHVLVNSSFQSIIDGKVALVALDDIWYTARGRILKTMPRDIPIANGNLLITFDSRYTRTLLTGNLEIIEKLGLKASRK